MSTPKDTKSLVNSLLGSDPERPESQGVAAEHSDAQAPAAEPNTRDPETPAQPADTQSLVGKLLGTPQNKSDPELNAKATSDEDTPTEPAPDPSSLIRTFFDLTHPDERDTCLEMICQSPDSVVTHFLEALVDQDPDPITRARGARELARRGSQKGFLLLEQQLTDPYNVVTFSIALDMFCKLQGEEFFSVLDVMWRDAQQPIAHRVEAMQAMERVDRDRTLSILLRYVEEAKDVRTLHDDILEAAMTAFYRTGHTPALAAIRALRERVVAANLEPYDEQDLLTLLDTTMEMIEEVNRPAPENDG